MDLPEKYTLLLGSNMGDRIGYLLTALAMIEETIGTITAKTTVHETPAWGNTNQDDFLNMALVVESHLSPLELLEKTQAIEARLDRQRTEHWGPRTLDIDILYAGQQVINHQRLTIPHPWLHKRKFTLELLAELAPDFMHPVLHLTNNQLLAQIENEKNS